MSAEAQVPEAATQAEAPAHEASETFDPGAHIMHHILDSHELEIPFTSIEVPLPPIHVGRFDLSITRNVVMMWIASAILLAFFIAAVRRVKNPVPTGIRGVLESMILFVRDDVARKTIDRKYADRYVGYLLTVFFFILACNLLGLIPGFSTPTSSISVTASLAALTFLVSQAGGIRNYGVLGHFKNLVPPGLPGWIKPSIFVLEVITFFVTRPLTLALRLFGNMFAGHLLLLLFITGGEYLMTTGGLGLKLAGAGSFGMAFLLTVFEILIEFLQAYIFTLLAAMYIAGSLADEH